MSRWQPFYYRMNQTVTTNTVELAEFCRTSHIALTGINLLLLLHDMKINNVVVSGIITVQCASSVVRYHAENSFALTLVEGCYGLLNSSVTRAIPPGANRSTRIIAIATIMNRASSMPRTPASASIAKNMANAARTGPTTVAVPPISTIDKTRLKVPKPNTSGEATRR